MAHGRFAVWGVLTSMAVLLGCTSDGGVGDNGIVRFSQVVHFAETEDFSASLGAGRSLLVALQEPQGPVNLGDRETRADLTMEVWKDGKKVDGAAWPLGFAQYAVNLKDPGDYRLVALQDGTSLDSVALKVAEQRHVRLSNRYAVVTHHRDLERSCTRMDELEDGLDNFTLHSNQTLTLFVVPEDEQKAPMLGLLPLSATVPEELEMTAQLVGHGAMANSLTVSRAPLATLGQPLELSIHEEESKEVLTLTLKTSSDAVTLDCSKL